MNKIALYINTVKHLKWVQVYYRVRNFLVKALGFQKYSSRDCPSTGFKLNFINNPICVGAALKNSSFTFLNLTVDFPKKIDWNYSNHGKLWTYNLNYFEFLHDQGVSSEKKFDLIYSYIESSSQLKDGLEPYPISLRAINWIRFLAIEKECKNKLINNILYSHLCFLYQNLEYHLLANHLLENAFALLMGSYFFRDENWYRVASKVLQDELKEQIHEDGGHFEKSPMYHSIILYRVLEAIDLILHNKWKEDSLLAFLKRKAASMVGWLDQVTFSDGSVPELNDTTKAISASTQQLLELASKLNIEIDREELFDSGYRMWKLEEWEVFLDVGNIGPDYQPGHAHADTFSFVLYYDNHPVIVDTGISTYESNSIRAEQRSTLMHNTVSYLGKDSSEVWGSFRVANRAKVNIVNEKNNFIEVVHNGYKKYGVKHARKFELTERSLEISDRMMGDVDGLSTVSLHFHPSINCQLLDNALILGDFLTVTWSGLDDVRISKYFYAEKFNSRIEASKFTASLNTQSKLILKANEHQLTS